MKRSMFVLTLLVLLMGSTTLMAQDSDDDERDILELSFYGGVGVPIGGLSDWHGDLGVKPSLMYGMDAGLFLNSNLVLGINFTYAAYSIDSDLELGDLKHRFYNPSLYLKHYFFGEGNLVPYIKGSVGVDNAKFTTELLKDTPGDPAHAYRELSYSPSPSVGLAGGAFYYTSDYSGIFLDLSYHHAFTSESDKELAGRTYQFNESGAWDMANSTMLEIHIGINVYFGSGE